jgi:hypothetical protein
VLHFIEAPHIEKVLKKSTCKKLDVYCCKDEIQLPEPGEGWACLQVHPPPFMVLPMPKPRMVGPGTLAKIIPQFRTVRKMCRRLITLCVLSLRLILIDNDKNCYTLYLNIS